ncbi:hypothetical protein [Clostridium sp. Marseille-QA1073]
MVEISFGQTNFFNRFLTSNIIASFHSGEQFNQLRIVNGRLAIIVEINF